MKSTKKSLLMSVLSLVLCFAMLLGTTYAWFTDSVTSGVNKIQAGNLDIEVTHSNAHVSPAESIEGVTAMFTDKNGVAMLWEPGAMSYENFTVKNVGNLALKYNMSMNVVDFNAVIGTNDNLKDALKVKVLTGAEILTSVTRGTVAALDWTSAQTLDQFKKDGGKLYPSTDTTTGHTSEEKFQVIVYWQPTDHDNDWNLQNGKTSTDGQPLFINFGITVVATQLEHEFDSFDNLYDASAQAPNIVMPSWSGESAAAALNATGATTYEIKSGEKVLGSLSVPAYTGITLESGTAADDDEYKLIVVPGTAHDDLVINSGNSEMTFDVSLHNVTKSTPVKSVDKPVLVTLDVGTIDVVSFHHKNSEYTEHVATVGGVTKIGQFYYEHNVDHEEHGKITFMTDSFSPFTTEFKFAGGLGTETHPYLIANREQMQAITAQNAISNNSYYKVADGVKTIDCNNWTTINLYGSFNGNGVTFTNLNKPLFAAVGKYNPEVASQYSYKVSNFTVADCNINSSYGFGIATFTNGNVTFENVRISGSITGTTSVGSFVEMGYLNGTVTFKNCVSTCNLIGDTVGGFFAHANEAGNIIIDNSYFDGTVFSRTGGSNVNYIAGNGTSGTTKTITFQNMGENSDKYILPDGILTAENGYTKEAFTCTWTQGINAIRWYKKSSSSDVLNINNISTAFNYGENITFAALSETETAQISLMVGPNDSTGFGNYLTTFEKETVTPENSNITSKTIFYSDITVDKAQTHGYNSGHTVYNVNWNSMGPSYHVAYIEIQEFNSSNTLIRISRVALPAYSAN